MALLEDSFTDADGTPLGDGTGGTHGPDVTSIGGYTYSTASRNCHISAFNNLETTSDGPKQVCTFDLGGADQQLIFQFPGDTQVFNSRICLRVVSDTDYGVGASTVGSGTCQITKRTGDSTTNIETFSFSAGDYIRLKAEGDTISWYHSTSLPADPLEDTNWTSIGSATNSNGNTETKAGFWLRGTSSSSTDDADWIDNLQADTFPAGGGGEEFDESVTLAAEAALTTVGNLTLSGALTLTTDAGINTLADVTFDGIVTLSAEAGYTAVGGGVFEASVSLSASAGIDPTAGVIFQGAVTLQSVAVIQQAAGLTLDQSLSLPASAGQEQSTAGSTFNVTVALGAESGLEAAGGFTIEESATLAASAAIEAAAAVITEAAIPPGETLHVEARGNTLTVSAGGRTFTVQRRHRTFTVN